MGDLHDAECLAAGLLASEVRGVVTLCPDAMSHEARESLAEGLAAQKVHHCEISARDDDTYDLVAGALPSALEFVQPFKAKGEAVLVHCQGGVNRGPAISVALLMRLDRLLLCNAVRIVVTNRGKVLTRRQFRAQLVQLAYRERLLGPMNDVSFLDPAPVIARTVPPASWKTSDGTRLLQLVLLSLQTGRGEEQRDSKGYTLRQWEEWYKNNGSRDHADWMADRAKAVRHSLKCCNLLWMGCAAYHVTWPVSQDSYQAIFKSFLS